jgi:hypothetical protein
MPLTPMRQTFTHRKRTGTGLYDPTYTDYTLQPCRFAQESRVVRRPNGQDITSDAVLRTTVAVGADDFVIYNLITYPVLTVRSITGVGGGIIEYEIRL